MADNNMDLNKLGLSVRAYNALCRARIMTIHQLCAIGPDKLRRLKNVGAKTVAEIEEKLAAYIADGAEEIEKPPEHPCELDYVQGYLDGKKVFRAAVVEALQKRENVYRGSVMYGALVSIRQMVEGLEVP